MLKKLGLIEKSLKIMYSYPAIIIAVKVCTGLLIYDFISIFQCGKLDWSLVEAARDLGAGKARAFWTVISPTARLLSGVILTFIPSMGLFFITDILGGNKVVLMKPDPGSDDQGK